MIDQLIESEKFDQANEIDDEKSAMVNEKCIYFVWRILGGGLIELHEERFLRLHHVYLYFHLLHPLM